MAEKKPASRAQKAADSKGKTSNTSTTQKKSTSAASKKTAPVQMADENRMPVRGILAVISIGLFLLFLIIGIKPEGALMKVLQSVLFGTIGKAGFYFLIPGFLYLFIILAFSGKQPVKMRCICVIVFVFLCGCLFHLAVNNQTFVGGLAVIADLYVSGLDGYSGGILCGTAAMLLRWACGTVLSYIILIIGAILTLLGSMKITVPSLIRAIKNRPRDDYEDLEEEPPEPAALVVNHFANKRIEHKRQRRQMLEQAEEDGEEQSFLMLNTSVPVPTPKNAASPKTKSVQKAIPAMQEPVEPVNYQEKSSEQKASDLMNQIGDIEAPVAAASSFVMDEAVKEEQPPETPKEVKPSPTVCVNAESEADDLIPFDMPAFKPEAPIPTGPKLVAEIPAPVVVEKVSSKDAAQSAAQVAAEIAKTQAIQKPVYCFPPIDLLRKPSRNTADGTAEMRENSRRLNETLESFKIDAHIINVTRGPSVTRYEVELDRGVRLSKLTGVADDIALSLGAPSVRIAPVPGQISVVGIEVPNRAVTTVTLREVIDSNEFAKSKSKSSFSVGKDIGGSCIVGNIAKMPHMLIAGTTGSGKSVCMNSIIISLLYKASPEDVKLIMVDPKMVELANYNGIPHLMIPVVTDPKKAAGSLQWAVTEMMRRYKSMSDAGVRDLESYNSIVMAEDGEKIPQLIVIIDELADLMLVAAKEVEDSICRIAQMGRAAGIHLVIATQRPSADVITGLMKANIPSRIAFSVASAMESRIILDTQGAEKLVGKGDMLYAPIGCGKPMRVQGCFVTDGEVEAVASYVKEHYAADYDQTVMDDIEKKATQTGKKPSAVSDPEPNTDELDGDEMLPAAVDVILETGQASVSMLQRRLKLGYARAARIVDEMEEKGIVGPFQGSKPRAILITKEQWVAQRSGSAQTGLGDMEDPFGGVPEEIL